MSGYRKVNYYELCRLCTSSEGNKMNIFRDEGRRRQLQTKIQTCLPIQVLEEDSLPKIVCHECIRKLESFIEFRETVVSAESMLESYFTSLRFSEDFLKEGKVYVKSTEKNRPTSPDNEDTKPMEKVQSTTENQIISNEHQIQQQQPIVMQPGGMASAVVEATAETHYSFQQQTSQVSPQQSNETQNQITEQQKQTPQLQQAQKQIQNHSQINQQVQSQRHGTQQQLAQSAQQMAPQQSQVQVSQQQQSPSQINQQIQQLQRQQQEFEKQHRQLQQIEKQQVQIVAQQEFSVKQESPTQVVHQNNNIVLKVDAETEQTQQIIQKVVQPEAQKDENSSQNVQSYTTVQASPEVFLSLGFKDSTLTTQSIRDESKELTKNSSDDGISRNAIGHISEFLRIRSGPEPSSLITVNPQVITQTTRNFVCRECGKSFASLNQMNSHNCTVTTIINDVADQPVIKEDPLQTSNGNSFSCDICGKPFKRKEHLFQHRKLHTGERPYVCTTCAKAFSRKEHLVRHSVSHTGQKMHECEMCGKSFSRKDNLHKHRKTHGVSGPYICETCGKSFVVKHYYVMHLTTHASTVTADGVNCQDPLPYKCDVCHKAFSVKQYLSTHRLRHRLKNNNSSAQNTLDDHHQQQQQHQPSTASVNMVGSTIVAPTNLNHNNNSNSSNNNGQANNGSTVEMQSVIERNAEQTNNGAFTNSQYHSNIQEFQ